MSAGHLVHGMGTALEAPTWPAITLIEAAEVLAHFPAVGNRIDLRWHSPRPFSAATLVATEEGDFVLKRHHHSVRTPDALAPEHGFMAHLRVSGISVPDIVRTAGGQGALALGEWTYEVHRSAPGVDFYRDRLSWTPYLNHGHAHAAGVAMARMHRAARNYRAALRGDDALIASCTILPMADPLAAARAYIMGRPALAAFLADRPWERELARLFGALGEGLAERLAEQAPLWTHNDWHPSNLLWSLDGKVETIFDFGLAARTFALHDLATAIERAAIPWLEIAEGRTAAVDGDAAITLLAGYRTVLPLANEDIETLVRLLPLVHVEFALSEVDYFAGIVGDPAQAEMAWQDYLVDHADWFQSTAGQALLARLRAEGSENVGI